MIPQADHFADIRKRRLEMAYEEFKNQLGHDVKTSGTSGSHCDFCPKQPEQPCTANCSGAREQWEKMVL